MTENLHSGQYFLMNDGCGPVGFEKTRFYDRQFITRDNQNRDILARFERLLDEWDRT